MCVISRFYTRVWYGVCLVVKTVANIDFMACQYILIFSIQIKPFNAIVSEVTFIIVIFFDRRAEGF